MQHRDILGNYLPDSAIDRVYEWIVQHHVHLKISRGRKTKLGDYRPPIRHPKHRISINHDLNPYAFLITFVHELAHLMVFEKYGTRAAPHGLEWKTTYRELMQELLGESIFPKDLERVLEKSIKNSKAASTSDLKLSRILQQYDPENGDIQLEDLDLNTIFFTKNGRKFQKGEKVRTRYKCQNLINHKYYLFHPLTPVVLNLS